MNALLGRIHHEDCVAGLSRVPDASVDLVFADPPFNIGYEYDEYDDRLEEAKYLEWSAQWMTQVKRVLKETGAFWLAIGDENAAELKLEAKKLGFQVRNWVVWYYTFGVHCHSKFTRSHAHLFYFVKSAEQITFNFPAISVPSARQLVYNDKRSNPAGRSPDDTWILRPQDCTEGFQADEDTWYFPRVAGTFKERAGFHGCQMPEQLLGRIIRACSNEGDVVMDPFSGSATTLSVAKKLGRSFFGFEMSKEYVERGTHRLDAIAVGDPLDGSEEPKGSAPSTYAHLVKSQRREAKPEEVELLDQSDGIMESFAQVHRGFSVERLIADPVLNEDFQNRCDRRGVSGTYVDRNRILLRLRKSGRLRRAGIATETPTEISWSSMDAYLHASEIAWHEVSRIYRSDLDEILCDPRLATELDRVAMKFAPGRTGLEYRWAAIKLRKEQAICQKRLMLVSTAIESVFREVAVPFSEIERARFPDEAGVFAMRSASDSKSFLYIGETNNLRVTLGTLKSEEIRNAWMESGHNDLQVQWLSFPLRYRLSNQVTLLNKVRGSAWNAYELTKDELVSSS